MRCMRIAYKILAVLLMGYALIYGLLMKTQLPTAMVLQNGQSSRNLFYHVPLWFGVITLAAISVVQSVRLLRMIAPDRETARDEAYALNTLIADARANEAASIAVMYNILGLLTGIVWSRVTWGEALPSSDFSAWWGWDPIQVCALISLLIYAAYFLLRSSFADGEQRAKISAVYNIFAFATLIPLYFILPKMLPGLHPTAQGSGAGGGSFIFKGGGINNDFRMILYPGMIGWVLLGVWIYELRSRLAAVKLRLEAAE